jgi:CrcB protein
MIFLLLALVATLGAVCRYHVTRSVQARTATDFPFGTFLINITGSVLLGFVVGLLAQHPEWPGANLTLLLGVGFCGAYTTFSSFAWETLQLWRKGRQRQALYNLCGQPVLGGLAAWAGIIVGSWSVL